MLPWRGNKYADQIKLSLNEMSLHGRKSAFTPSLSSGTAHCTPEAKHGVAVGPQWLLSEADAHLRNFLTLSVIFKVTRTCQG